MKKMNNILSFFCTKQHPRERYIYAVTAGAYLGELLVYSETKANIYSFLSLPSMSNREIPIEKFTLGLKEGIIDVVEKMPRKVYDVCELQYQKNRVQKI